MRIIDARWTPTINYLIIECECGLRFVHRADRWKVRCHHVGLTGIIKGCEATAHLGELRQRYAFEHAPTAIERELHRPLNQKTYETWMAPQRPTQGLRRGRRRNGNPGNHAL